MINKINILVADDHDLVLKGFLLMLKTFSFVDSVHGVSNGKEVIERIKNHKPDLILMDLDMPVKDGIDTSEIVLKKYPDVKIIILSGLNDDEVIFHAIELGVHGYILKDANIEELKNAIESVLSTGFYYTNTVVNIMRKGIIRDSGKPNIQLKYELTVREKQILKMLCHEKTTKEIAAEIFLSDRTIEKIRKNLAHKLSVKGTAGLVRFAVKNGYDL